MSINNNHSSGIENIGMRTQKETAEAIAETVVKTTKPKLNSVPTPRPNPSVFALLVAAVVDSFLQLGKGRSVQTNSESILKNKKRNARNANISVTEKFDGFKNLLRTSRKFPIYILLIIGVILSAHIELLFLNGLLGELNSSLIYTSVAVLLVGLIEGVKVNVSFNLGGNVPKSIRLITLVLQICFLIFGVLATTSFFYNTLVIKRHDILLLDFKKKIDSTGLYAISQCKQELDRANSAVKLPLNLKNLPSIDKARTDIPKYENQIDSISWWIKTSKNETFIENQINKELSITVKQPLIHALQSAIAAGGIFIGYNRICLCFSLLIGLLVELSIWLMAWYANNRIEITKKII